MADERRDVVVVGGGLVGLAVGWRARRRGLDALVLERGRPGAAASFVGAGILAPVSETTVARPGLAQIAVASAEAYPAFAQELTAETGVPVDLRRCGILHVACDEEDVARLRALEQTLRELGRSAEWLDAARCRTLEPGLGSCEGGLHVPGDGVVDPRTLTAALVAALGDAVAARRAVTGALLEGGRIVGVETATGPVRAEQVVLAAGAWSGVLDWLPAEARPPVRPVKGQLAVVRPPAGVAPPGPVVWTGDVYVAARGDGRVVVGGTVEDAGFDTTVQDDAIAGLLVAAERALPALAAYELVEALAALRPAAADGLPLVGPGALEGLVLATGHFRHGILLAPATADAVAALLAGEPLPPLLAPLAPARLVAPAAAS